MTAQMAMLWDCVSDVPRVTHGGGFDVFWMECAMSRAGRGWSDEGNSSMPGDGDGAGCSWSGAGFGLGEGSGYGEGYDGDGTEIGDRERLVLMEIRT